MPLPAPMLFHETAYGAVRSSAPRLAPSSLNCTPPTSAPRGLTLARTMIVPATVDPEAGDVMVTTSPPGRCGSGSCAKAGRGDINDSPRIASRASANESLTRLG